MEVRNALFYALLIISTSIPARGESIIYHPLGAWNNPSAVAFDRWTSLRQSFSEVPRAEGKRPILPGVHSRDLELFQDVIARDYPRVTEAVRSGSSKSWIKLGKLSSARNVIANSSPETVKTSFITSGRGYMAEALFVDLHPEWNYIKSRTAKQHDVYTPNGGRGNNIFGQVKYHINGDPKVYAADMIKDSRSQRFIVPDDHLQQLRKYLISQGRTRDANRLMPLGYTSSEIASRTLKAQTEARLVRYTPYISLGLLSALAYGPILHEWLVDDISTEKALSKLGKASIPLGASVGLTKAISYYGDAKFAGSFKANGLISVVFIVGSVVNDVYSYGGLYNASQNPQFWLDTSANIGAVALGGIGMYAGGAAGGSLGPAGSVVGGLAGGLILGTIGAIGGKEVGGFVLKNAYPELFYKAQDGYTDSVVNSIQNSIKLAQGYPPP